MTLTRTRQIRAVNQLKKDYDQFTDFIKDYGIQKKQIDNKALDVFDFILFDFQQFEKNLAFNHRGFFEAIGPEWNKIMMSMYSIQSLLEDTLGSQLSAAKYFSKIMRSDIMGDLQLILMQTEEWDW